MFEDVMMNIGASLCDHAISDNEKDRHDEDDEDTEHGKLTIVEEPSWVASTISITVRLRMQRFQQKQMQLDDLTKPG